MIDLWLWDLPVTFWFTEKKLVFVLVLARSLINNFSSVLVLICIIILVIVSVRDYEHNFSFSSILV